MKLDFILIEGTPELKISLASDGINPELIEVVKEKVDFSFEIDEFYQLSNFNVVSLKDDLLAFIIPQIDGIEPSKNELTIIWVLLFKKEDFLNIFRCTALITTEIVIKLRNHIFQVLEIKSFADLAKRIRKSGKNLPIYIENLFINEKEYYQKANVDFLNLINNLIEIRENLPDFLDKVYSIPLTIFKSSLTDGEQVLNLIKLIYYITPLDILFKFNFLGNRKPKAPRNKEKNLIWLNINEENKIIQESLINQLEAKKAIFEIPLKIELLENSGKKKKLTNFLVNNSFSNPRLNDLINLEKFFKKYRIDDKFKRDIDNYISFTLDYNFELDELANWLTRYKTQIIILFSSFQMDRSKYESLNGNGLVLKRFHELYERYSNINEVFRQFLNKIIEDLSLDEKELTFAINFSTIKEIVDILKNSPFESLRNLIVQIMDNLKLPDWLVEIKRLGLLEKINEFKKLIPKDKDGNEIFRSLKADSKLRVELDDIIPENIIQQLRIYTQTDEMSFRNYLIQLFKGEYSYFLMLLITNDSILDLLTEISREIFLNLEKERRTNDNIQFILNGLWFRIIHRSTLPETYWSEKIEENIFEIQNLINLSAYKDDLKDWTVPLDFKDLLIKLLDEKLNHEFRKFNEFYYLVYNNVYDVLLELKTKYDEEQVNEAILAKIENINNETTEFEIKFMKMIKQVGIWNQKFNPPKEIFTLLINSAKPEQEENIARLNEFVKYLDELMLKYADVLNSKEIVKSFKEYLLNVSELKDKLTRVQLINELHNNRCLYFLANLRELNRPELIKEASLFIKNGKFSEGNILGIKFYRIFQRLHDDKEKLYSDEFKNEILLEAFIDHLETNKAFGGLPEYLNYYNELENLINS